jgi:hypothetical protein
LVDLTRFIEKFWSTPGPVVSPKFLEQRGVGSSARFALFPARCDSCVGGSGASSCANAGVHRVVAERALTHGVGPECQRRG